MPARSMSRMRASMSKQPGRISSKRAGSMLHSARGRPTTALSPTLGYSFPSKTQLWVPSSCSMTRGAAGRGRLAPLLEEIRGLDQVVVDRDHGHQDRPGLRVGEQGGPARCGPCVDGSHGKVTLSSVKLSGSGVRMTTYVDDVSTRVGLLIDGDLVAGGEGTYPVTNPARPAEVVLDAPSTSPAQLDLAVGAARRSQRAWAALEPAERAAIVVAAAEAGVAAVERHDLARFLTREHGKTHLEAIFDTATMGGMAAAFAPLVAEALAARDVSGGATRIEWVPHGVVAAVLPFNWPVSVMGNKVLPALLAGDTVVVKAPPSCPGTVLLVAAAMAEVLPLRRPERRERPFCRTRCRAGGPSRRRHGLLHR